MTDPTPQKPSSASPTPPAAATAAPGWYPVAGTTQQRWWDGTKWTEHVHDPATAWTGGVLKAPEGTNPNTVWFWLLAVGAPVLQAALLLLESAWLGSISNLAFEDPQAMIQAEFSPSYFAIFGLGWLFVGLFVVGSALDFRTLRARGVPRPFHWAWAFLGVLVYAIGRSVVVRRRTGTGMTPLWVFIALNVVVFVVAIVVVVGYLAAVFSHIPTITN